jgi:membrane dipeptidase
MFTIDAHLDLSMNAMEWNRDLRKTVFEIRERENKLKDKPDRGRGTVAFPELRRKILYLAGTRQNRHGRKRRDSLPGTKQWKLVVKW